MRPIAALRAGLLADHFRSSKVISVAFVLLITAALAVFAIRGVYFAMLEEIRTPQESTGITVGIISLVGFTPDVFGYWLSGWLTDTYGSTLGHQLHFGILGIMAVVGFLATVALFKRQSG